MEELIKILDKVGFKKSHIEYFTDVEGRPEGVTIDDIVKEVQEHQEEVFISKKASDLKKQGGDEAVENYKKSEKARIVKLAGLGLTRREQEELSLEDVIQKAEEAITTATSGAGDSEELRNELNSWKQKATEAKQALETREAEYEDEIAAAKADAQKQVDNFHIERLFNGLRDKAGEKPRSWASDDRKLTGHHYITSLINERYNVMPDGTIVNKSDGSKATSWDGNAVYENVREAYEAKFAELGLGKKSNGGEGDDDDKIVVDNLRNPEKRSEATNKILERAKKFAETHPHRK